MNIAGKIALVGAGAAIGTLGATQFGKYANGVVDKRLNLIDSETQTATRDWNNWSSAFDAEIGSRNLDTPADHARFAAFLQSHPAPSWVKVEHKDFTTVHVTAKWPLTENEGQPDPIERAFFSVGSGVMLAAGGAYAAFEGIRSHGSAKTTLAMTVGGVAAVLLGGELATLSVQDVARGDSLDGARALVDRVNSGK